MFKKTAVALMSIACLSVLLTGCTPGASVEPASTFTPSPGDVEVKLVKVPVVVSLSIKEATTSLESKGFKVAYDDENIDINDGTEWVVSAQPVFTDDKAAKGSIIYLVLVPYDDFFDTNPAKDTKVTTTGLSLKEASIACIKRATDEHPGFLKVLWSSGKISETVEGENAVIRYAVETTDAKGVVSQAVMSCTVTGTDKKPEIVSFELG